MPHCTLQFVGSAEEGEWGEEGGSINLVGPNMYSGTGVDLESLSHLFWSTPSTYHMYGTLTFISNPTSLPNG